MKSITGLERVKEIGVMVWIGFFWLKVCSTVISVNCCWFAKSQRIS
jgi:hypothetical protein